MARCCVLNQDYYIARNRCGEVSLWERNPVYEYYAIIRTFGERLKKSHLYAISELTGLSVASIAESIQNEIREGGRGMISKPNYTLEMEV